MTQENEMPPKAGTIHQVKHQTEYIRRAVTKEEAGEALRDLEWVIERWNNSPKKAYLDGDSQHTIRKLLEAHK